VFLAVALLACLAMSACIEHSVVGHFIPVQWSDLYSPYAGARAMLHGQDPYSPAVTASIQTGFYGHVLRPGETWDRQAFVYPAYAAFLFAPIAYLPWPVARTLTTALLPVLFLFSIFLWMRMGGFNFSRGRKIFLAGCFAFSWPAIYAFQIQQPSVAVFAALAVGCYLLTLGKDALAGVVLALCTIKPQLTAPLLLWLLVWTLMHRRPRFAVGFGAMLSALMLATQLREPGWFSQWRAAAISYGSDRHQPLFLSLFGAHLGLVAIALLAATVCYALTRIHSLPQSLPQSTALVLAFTASVSPTNSWMIYNQVLLVPALLFLLARRDRPRAVTIAACLWSFAMPSICAAIYLAIGYREILAMLPFWNVFLPAIVTVTFCVRCCAEPIAAGRTVLPQPLFQISQ
jgi:hypothetical protein